MIFSGPRFFQKIKKRIRLYYYYVTSGRLVFVRFLEEIEDTKDILEIKTKSSIRLEALSISFRAE
jgi:hypothetical protein